MSNDIFDQLLVTGTAVRWDQSFWYLSLCTIAASANWKIRAARKSVVASGSSQLTRGSNPEFYSPIKFLSRILRVYLASRRFTRLILGSRALCRRRDRQRH